jgi:FkbM family methyltransferase
MTDTIPTNTPLISYAQNFEDVILWRALRHVENGFYIDVGAQDPIEDSVSLGFYEKGWRGVHVEPTLHYAGKLRAARPDETVIQAAIAAEAGLLHFYEVVETGLSTGDSAQAEHHRQAGFTIRETDVPSMPLGALFDRFGDRPIHWLKIDVEGFEQQVLESRGDNPARPWIVVVEAVVPGTQTPSHQGWDGLLTAKGYAPVYFDGLNRYYLSDAHRDLAPHFRSGPNVFDEFVLSGTSTNRFSKLLTNRIDHLSHRLEELQQRLDHAVETHRVQQEEGKAKLIATIRDLQHAQAEAREFHIALDELYKSHTDSVQEYTLRLQNAELVLADAEREAARQREELQLQLSGLNEQIYAVNMRLAGVLDSLSWKITRPLRLAVRLTRSLARFIVGFPSWFAARLRRLPATAIAQVRSRPGLKRIAVALINRVPGLAARARRYASQQPPTITAAPITRPPDPSGSHLSASARRIRARLASRSRGTTP